jgi:hypothetical protein
VDAEVQESVEQVVSPQPFWKRMLAFKEYLGPDQLTVQQEHPSAVADSLSGEVMVSDERGVMYDDSKLSRLIVKQYRKGKIQ